MVKRHLKRLTAPRSWDIKRKSTVFVTRPKPGPHSYDEGVSLNIVLRDLLGYANTTKEVKKALNNNIILVDGIRRRDHRFIVGLMDVISIPKLKENYRILVNKKGKLVLIKIDEKEAKIKPCKIIGKTPIKGKTQLNLFDGRNIIVEKETDYKVGDSVVIEIPSQKILQHLKLENKAFVIITKGRRVGNTGKIENISRDEITCKTDSGEVIETKKRYVFVIGKEKPVIKIKES